MIDEGYPFLECRDLRHSWRGQLEHRLVRLPQRQRRRGDLRADFLLVRSVACLSCGTVRTESFAVRQDREGTLLVGEKVKAGYTYPAGYQQHGGPRASAADFRAESLVRVLREGRATMIEPEEG